MFKAQYGQGPAHLQHHFSLNMPHKASCPAGQLPLVTPDLKDIQLASARSKTFPALAEAAPTGEEGPVGLVQFHRAGKMEVFC